MLPLVILTNPYQYIIALCGLYNAFVIDFDKKSVDKHSQRQRDILLLETFKETCCCVVETIF